MPTLTAAASATERAFPAHPCVDRYFAGGSVEDCRNRLVRAVQRGDGPALLVGSPGMGKSMLMAVVSKSLGDGLQVVLINSTQLCTRRALLQAILFGLGLPYQDRDEGELRLALATRLERADADTRPVALLIDEAQTIAVRLLEELRVITNVTRDGEPMVRLVLAGTQGLEEQLASTELESLNQRLATRCYLSPLNYGETHQYVRAHIAAAGGDPGQLLSDGALDCIYNATDGVPRLINQLCDRAVVMAVEGGVETIDEPLVQQAWSDLHQLPAPWNTPDATLPEPESSVVEFGVLPEAGDATDEHAAAIAIAQTPVGPVDPESPGLWNADDALAEIADGGEQPSEVVAEQAEAAQATQPAVAAPPNSTPDADELFGDGFDDEEVVIDRFAALEIGFSASTPAVTNRQDPPIAFDAPAETAVADPLQSEPADEDAVSDSEPPRVESEHPLAEQALGQQLIEPVPARAVPLPEQDIEPPAPEPEAPLTDFPLESPQPERADVLPIAAARFACKGDACSEDSCCTRCEVPAASAVQSDRGDVLIIEQEPVAAGAAPAQVKRQEYRQLFASLRSE